MFLAHYVLPSLIQIYVLISKFVFSEGSTHLGCSAEIVGSASHHGQSRCPAASSVRQPHPVHVRQRVSVRVSVPLPSKRRVNIRATFMLTLFADSSTFKQAKWK